MKRHIRFYFGALLALWLVQGAWAQQQDPLEAGKQAFREERYGDAAQHFERITLEDPNNAEAFYLLSRVYFETPLYDVKKAGAALDAALKIDPDNVLFLVARLQQLRTDSWNFFAEKIKEIKRLEVAHKILDLDPANAFAHEELGTSYIRDFWRYRNAVMIPTLLQRQGANNLINSFNNADPNRNNIGVNDGTLTSASSSLDFGTAFDPARVFVADKFDVARLKQQGVPVQDLSARAQRAYEKAIEHLQRSLDVDPRRRSVYDEMMQIYALKGEYGEALKMLQQMYRFFPEDPYLWTYLGLAHYRTGNMEAADRSFETAFRYMNPNEQGAYGDLSYLLPQDEERRYEQDPVLYASRYWTSKDPRYLTTFNERRLEHYARLTYADLLYGAPDVDLRGWDTERGRILVRYGQPLADVIIMPRTVSEAFARQTILLNALRPIDDISNPSQDPDDPTAPTFQTVDTDQPGLPPAPRKADLFEELNTYNIWDYGAFRFVFEDPFRNGEYRLYSPPASDLAAGADGWINDYVMRARETFRKIPERYEYQPPGRQIDLPYLTSAFRGEGGRTDLYIHYGIPIVEYDRSKPMVEITANTGMFLISQDRDMLVERRRTIYGLPTVQIVDFEEAHLWVDTQQMQAPPGHHDVSVEFETASGATVAVQRRAVTVPDFSQDRLAISDIMLAYRVEESPDGKPLGASEIVRNGLSILPAPWSVYATDQPIYLYFETYNLEPDQTGKTDYDVEILLVPKERARGIAKLFKGLLGGEKGVSVTYQGSGTLRSEGLYQILDASDQEMGLYTLILRLRDNVAKRTVEEEQDLFLEQ